MQKTLIAIGNEILKQQGEWDNLIETPKFNDATPGGEPITNYTLVVVFDIDNQTIIIDNDGLYAFNPKDSPIRYRNINSELWGRRGDPWMITCSYPKKLPILQKSIFGKPDEDIGQGLFQKSIVSVFPEAKNTQIYKALEKCYLLRNINIEENVRGIDSFQNEYISTKIELPNNHKIVQLSISIKSNELGIDEPKLLSELEGYDLFIKKRFSVRTKESSNSIEKLCYISGKKSTNANLPSFPDREDLNNIFVTTTINYASNLDKNSFPNNYKIDQHVQQALRNGSNYIRGKLGNQRCSVRIANTEHFFIPTFLQYDDLDIKSEMDNIRKISEWVFTTKDLDNLIEGLEYVGDEKLFWINYIAYASDGNSVKVINHIKDVSSVWLRKIVETDTKLVNIFAGLFNQSKLNLSTIYYSIPIRKDHEQKNDALKLLSQILEQRKINVQKIFVHFTELIMCHWFKRYHSYSNISFKPDNFDFAVRDSIIKYFFLLKLFKSLNLIHMEEIENVGNESQIKSEKLAQYFIEMGYTPQQESLYWLGRMINNVGTAQYNKGHIQKPVLNKINYNGMDYSKIQRLYVDVFKLATQYNIANKIGFSSNKFAKNFPANEGLWNINPQEAVFYILS